MKEYDAVELIVEKECYTKHGVHKGMMGWICDKERIHKSWLVCFDQDEYFDEFPIIGVKETDLKVICDAKTE